MTKARSNSTAEAAKGDLRAGTGTNTSGILAVGSNGYTLVADSAATTGLNYAPTVFAGKNFLINGNFDIWQRGTSFASTGYMADRWSDLGQLSNMTASQQTTTPPDGSRYVLRYTCTSTSNPYKSLFQIIETNNTSILWGKVVTFSIKVRRDSTMTANIGINIDKSSTVDAGSGATWTTIASNNITTTSSILANTWTTISLTTTIPNDGTANTIRVGFYFNANPANGSYIEFAQAQLELGSSVTNFARAGGTIQGELAACQRYLPVVNIPTGGTLMEVGANLSTTQAIIPFKYQVQPRVAPTGITYTGTIANCSVLQGSTQVALTNLQMNVASLYSTQIIVTVASGLTTGYAVQFRGENSASTQILMTGCEL